MLGEFLSKELCVFQHGVLPFLDNLDDFSTEFSDPKAVPCRNELVVIEMTSCLWVSQEES